MTILQLILLIVVMLSGWPVGRFIASKTTEELEAGKIWFKLICAVSLAAVIISPFIFQGDTLVFLVASCFFIFLLSLASLMYKKRK